MPSSEFAGGVAGPDACTESGAPLDIAQVLESVGATAYRWDFNTDTIEWADNAGTMLEVADMAKLGKGRAFALHIDPEHAGARYDGVTGAPRAEPGAARRYALHYRFLPDGRRGKTALWV